MPQEQLVHRNKTAAAMRRLQAHQRENDPDNLLFLQKKIVYDETKRRKRAVMTEEELSADRKSKAETRSNQQLKKSMAFFGIDDRKGEARKSEETVPDLQYNISLSEDCPRKDHGIMLHSPTVEVSKWSPSITIITRGEK